MYVCFFLFLHGLCLLVVVTFKRVDPDSSVKAKDGRGKPNKTHKDNSILQFCYVYNIRNLRIVI